MSTSFGQGSSERYDKALAEATREPLLFKGNDFALTDIEVA